MRWERDDDGDDAEVELLGRVTDTIRENRETDQQADRERERELIIVYTDICMYVYIYVCIDR